MYGLLKYWLTVFDRVQQLLVNLRHLYDVPAHILYVFVSGCVQYLNVLCDECMCLLTLA